MNQPPSPPLKRNMEYQREICNYFPTCMYTVYRSGTRWACRKAYVPNGDEESLDVRLQEILVDHAPMQLVFENELTLAKFLADPNPVFEPLRAFIRLTRQHGSFHVATMAELATAAEITIPATDDHWSVVLPNLKLTIAQGNDLVFDPLMHLVPDWHWCLNDVTNNPSYAYQYETLIAYTVALGAIADGKPQGTIDGMPVRIAAHTSFDSVEMTVPIHGLVMVVPRNPSSPVLNFQAESARWHQLDDRNPCANAEQAMLYMSDPPPLSDCHHASLPKRPSRELPLDVLAAAQPVT